MEEAKMLELVEELDEMKECTDIAQQVDPRDFIRVIEIVQDLVKASQRFA